MMGSPLPSGDTLKNGTARRRGRIEGMPQIVTKNAERSAQTKVNAAARPPVWMIWDGECNFCRRAAAWFKRHDTRNRIRPCPYQQVPTPPMTPEMYRACEFSVHVITEDGRVLRGGRAALHLLEQVGYGTVARLLALPPFIWAVEIAYKIVANNRDFFARFFLTRENAQRTDLVQP